MLEMMYSVETITALTTALTGHLTLIGCHTITPFTFMTHDSMHMCLSSHSSHTDLARSRRCPLPLCKAPVERTGGNGGAMHNGTDGTWLYAPKRNVYEDQATNGAECTIAEEKTSEHSAAHSNCPLHCLV